MDHVTIQGDNNNDHPSPDSFGPSMRMIIKARLANIEKPNKKVMEFIDISSQ